MLRSEHVIARLRGGRLIPHRLVAENGRTLEVARELCELYAAHVHAPRSLLEESLTLREEALGPRLDPRRGFKIVRALSKLLEERASWAAPTTTDPYTLRTRIFELAAALPEPPAAEPSLLDAATRKDVLSQVAREMNLKDPAAVMYADRRGSQLLEEHDPFTPEGLIDRYNVAQVQGVLYAARELTVDLGPDADARLVFDYVKKLGLIYRLEPTHEGHRLHLDGPLSLFGGTRKYGLRLSKFLPGLLLTAPWKLSASVDWKGRDTVLETDSSSGLKSHYRGPKEIQDRDEDVLEAFARAWARAKDSGGWRLEPGPAILPIPGQRNALIPDFTLRHADTGEEVHLEVLGFWSERVLVDRIALLREAGRRGHRVLIAVSDSFGSSPATLSEASGGEIVVFKNRLNAKSVLEALSKPIGDR